jgi:alpha-galactosidase
MDHIRFDAGEITLIIICAPGTPPQILHWGKRLSDAITVADLLRLNMRQGGPGSADAPVPASLAMEPGLGLLGPCGFSAYRNGRDWGSLFTVSTASQTDRNAQIICHDLRTRLRINYQISVDANGIITIASHLINEGDTPLDLSKMDTAYLPIPQSMRDIIGFTGRWSGEFQRERFARFTGAYVRENRRGRTSHDSFPAVILCEPSTNENMGDAYGLHLAWSGNHHIRVDSLSDGRVFAGLGALLIPGEIQLEPGEIYHSPPIIAGYSAEGFAALSRHFHDHVRTDILRPSTRARSRPVHYNTWEAVYFNHDLGRLKIIAERAAAIGVERFVLDDGWFGKRRNDRAGLGDWTVSSDVYPEGLGPLIDHVTGLGMEMGLWFEPEMINPDSDLYRAHPDWVLEIKGIDQIAFRHQYVLDIARAEVSDYLFARIDALLRAYDIGYIKWDMNRDLNHPGGVNGEPRAHRQVNALYALIDRIRAAHPQLEIETCSSGGARPDLGILAHTDRIWTSDTNDAIDRQAIQRGASFFLPLDVLGAHVGPRRCHVTGRTLSMAMRAGTAIMGHMGLELNLMTEDESELAELKTAITLYKMHRALLHNGAFQRIDTPNTLNIIGVVAKNQSEALVSVAFLTGDKTTLPNRLHMTGLNPHLYYRIRLIWPVDWHSQSSPSIMEGLDLRGQGTVLPGDALMTVGMQLPLTLPETVLLFYLNAEGQSA